jgi:hypothetical protein
MKRIIVFILYLSILFLPAYEQPSLAAKQYDKTNLQKVAKGLNPKIMEMALTAWHKASQQKLIKKQILAIIDYSLPSTEKRLWIFDLQRSKLLFNELVAHGKGTGENYAKHFSNIPQSLQSSLGIFQTLATYSGKHGYSLKLKGLEPGFNDKAEERSIVIHGAWYVSQAFAKQYGRLGRSWGCPALDKKVTRQIIDVLKDGAVLMIYFPDIDWLKKSNYLKS